ncbi:cold-shock protein [Rhizobium sp. 11515TR]|uniref:cold-shock protein n=1 Tax=Rhizobium sp. 11515TR TaxID=2028343 RepID=UPI000BA841AC|nr:cold-shock protein [Rhizobium sp. 11515TR]ASW04723.1 cold-shock protein [Rhizobium sp. 11515TR]
MTNGRYRPGDSIVLKPGIFGYAQPAGSIVSVLPVSRGVAHYRVRFQNESFERRVRQDDIDAGASPSSLSPTQAEVPQTSKSSWINSNSIRTKK